MAVSKVVFGNTTVMDITDSTVDAGSLLAGKKAYGANGEAVNGSLVISDRIRWNEAKTSVKKNLINLDLNSVKAINTSGTWSDNVYTYNDVTFTFNSDNTVTVNGTANSSGATLDIYSDTNQSCPYNGYILSGCPSGGAVDKYDLRVSDVTSGSVQDYGSGATISLSDTGKWRASILIRANQTVSNLTFKPMIRLSTIEDDTYVPYIPDNVELDSKKADVSSLATVATSGSYNDLSNKPTIPSATEVVFATGSFVSSTSDATTITATNSSIDLPSGATVEVCADVYNYPCSDVSTSGSGTSATITAVFPKDSVSRTINYKIYAKTI